MEHIGNCTNADYNNAVKSSDKTKEARVGMISDLSDFMKILTLQIQNQDPLSPMDNIDFTQQLLSFNMMEQSVNTNQKFDALLEAQYETQHILAKSFDTDLQFLTNSLGLIGNTVLADGRKCKLEDNKSASFFFEIEEAASHVVATIYNKNDEVIGSQDIGTKASGSHEFSWSGHDANGNKLPSGDYIVDFKATKGDGTPIDVQSKIKGVVDTVEMLGGTPYLSVNNLLVDVRQLQTVFNTKGE